MKLEVLQEKKNPLLDRREVRLRLDSYEATPSRTELVEEIAKKTGGKKEGVYIRKVGQSYGATKAVVTADIYESAAALEKRVHKKHMRTTGKNKPRKPE